MPLNNDQMKFFADFIEEKLGIIYSKDNYYQLERRLSDISTQLNLSSTEELWQKAQGGVFGQMKMLLLDLATNNETSFFRDAGLFKAIEERVLMEPRFAGDNPHPLRIWSCATSTGQEVYTMAILLNAWKRFNANRTFTFYATDYSERVLKQAEEGRYTQLEIQRGLPATMLVRYFHNEVKGEASGSHGPSWVVNDELKKGIIFKQQNLLEDFGPIGPFDLVMCRNVLIYQSVEKKRKIISEIARRMAPGGYLVLGAAESLMGLSDDFEQKQLDRAVIYEKKSALASIAV
jgi:chemotaxis protein methyltransferase CheR